MLRRLLASAGLAIASASMFTTMGCAPETAHEGSTAKVEATFPDGSTYALDGANTPEISEGNVTVHVRLREPSSGDELDLAFAATPPSSPAPATSEADATLTLVRSNAKKAIRLQLAWDDWDLHQECTNGSCLRVSHGQLTLSTIPSKEPTTAPSAHSAGADRGPSVVGTVAIDQAVAR